MLTRTVCTVAQRMAAPAGARASSTVVYDAFGSIFSGAQPDAKGLAESFARARVAVPEQLPAELAAALSSSGSTFTASQLADFVAANPSNPAAWALNQLAARLGSPAAAGVTVSESGELGTIDYRLFFSDLDGNKVSVWHDVSLLNEDGTMNMIVEIPRFTRAKMEISTDEQFNPIKQDTSKGLPREYKWGDMLFNYGALPQTWEDPAFTHPATSAAGDNDPVDIIDVGTTSHPIGSVIKVKPLGVLGMIDQGEMDWKVIAISTADPMAAAVNSIADLRVVQPTAVEAFDGWMRDYKTADGKPTNHIEYVTGWDTPEFAKSVITEANEHWATLVASGRREL